ncbi:MAG: hypothetical protein QQN63_02215 [Nitrosopumilus sp.]
MADLILDLCGGTGAWSKPYKNAGYRVIIIDTWLQKDGDIRLHEFDDGIMPVRGILCAPPCTHFAASGAQYWKSKGSSALIHGMSIVDACLRLVHLYKPRWWALENPKGRLINYLGQPKIRFDPYDYGDPVTKLTYVWGNFSVPVRNPVEPWMGSSLFDDGGKRDQRERSVTPPGFATAFFNANP